MRTLRISVEFFCLVPATDLACSHHSKGTHPFIFFVKPQGVKSAKQRAVEKNPIGMQRLGIILFGPFGIFFQVTASLNASTKNLFLIHASPSSNSIIGTGCMHMSPLSLH